MKTVYKTTMLLIAAIIFLALPVVSESSVNAGRVTFEFWPDDSDWDYCGDEMYVYLSYWSETEDGYVQLYFDPKDQYFYRSVQLKRGYCEFYFSVCEEPLDSMKNYEDWFSPTADHYVDDGYGGYNAWVQVY